MMEIISAMLNRKDGKRAKGFTLIELLVVVIIIGILAAIAVPIYLNQRKAAWNASVVSDVKNASLVVETLSTENNGAIPDVVNGTYGEGKQQLGTTGEYITISKGNHITIAVGTGTDKNTYTITGWNSNLNVATETPTSGARTTYSSATGTLSNAK